MEYLGFLSLAAAVAAIGFRFYFSMKRETALQTDTWRFAGRRNAAKPKQMREATLARKLLRHHLALSRA